MTVGAYAATLTGANSVEVLGSTGDLMVNAPGVGDVAVSWTLVTTSSNVDFGLVTGATVDVDTAPGQGNAYAVLLRVEDGSGNLLGGGTASIADTDTSASIGFGDIIDPENIEKAIVVIGAFPVAVLLSGDGGGAGSDALSDDCECTKSQGFWEYQFTASVDGDGRQKIENASLEMHLDTVSSASSVFGESVPLNTLADANNVFNPAKGTGGTGTGKGTKGSGKGSGSDKGTKGSGKGSGSGKGTKGTGKGSGSGKGGSGTGSNPDKKLTEKKQIALQQTLAAWLNFAKGANDWDEDIVVDSGSGTGSKPSTPATVMPFNEIIAEVEAILNNPQSTADDFEHTKDLAESVNTHNP